MMNKNKKLLMISFINSLEVGDKVVSYNKFSKIETIYNITDAKVLLQVYNRLKRDILVFNHEIKAYIPDDEEMLSAVITVRKPNMLLTI